MATSMQEKTKCKKTTKLYEFRGATRVLENITLAGRESKAGYVLCLMGVFWCTEVLPLGITALMPLFLVPLLGIIGAKDISYSYMNETTFIFMGGFFMAAAVEKSNVHRRIAIKILLTIGSSPRWLMLGFMLPTWFLSMWISNTATTAMMMPIVQEVMERLSQLEKEKNEHAAKSVETQDNSSIAESRDGPEDTEKTTSPEETKSNQNNTDSRPEEGTDLGEMGKAMVMSVAFAANAGGTGTIIGTGPNLLLRTNADQIWMEKGLGESPINFTSWMVLGLPLAVLNFIIIWIWLELYYIGFREFLGLGKPEDPEKKAVVKSIMQNAYQKLGPIKPQEIQVGVVFILLVLLWFLRAPDFIEGWRVYFPDGYITDAVPAILISVLLFAIPTEYPSKPDGGPDMLNTWAWIKLRYQWDVILVFGGGFALGETTRESGLSDWIGDQLVVLESLPGWLMITILGLFATIMTSFISNVACASLLLPIVAPIGERLGWNPLYLMIPVAISVQYSFMLPVSTAPNAIAYSTGWVKVWDMVKAGAFLNLVCTFVMTFGVETWIMAYFNLDTIPWDITGNITSTALPECCI